MNFKIIFKIMGMVLFAPFLYAHSPDLSSLMIYEENGKTFLVIKSSIAAFEGEVVYLYGKESYKTPQEFNELASISKKTVLLLLTMKPLSLLIHKFN
jgi:hypothetical protein